MIRAFCDSCSCEIKQQPWQAQGFETPHPNPDSDFVIHVNVSRKKGEICRACAVQAAVEFLETVLDSEGRKI